MDFGLSPEAIRAGLILFLLLVTCLCLRAYGQAWLAHRLGDDTPQAAGRLTVNPLPHIDLIGTVVLPLICIFYLMPRLSGITFFLAWAKPVPINPSSFARPSRDYLFTQLMNPLVSVLIAAVAAVAAALVYRHNIELRDVLIQLMLINSSLIVLDFLPIPPLPGGMLLRQFGLISEELYWSIARWGGLLLLIAFNIRPFQVFFSLLVSQVALPFYALYLLIVR